MARVALEGVSKVYPGDVTAVQRIDLEVNDQEFLVLVGPSGCGKTTTLRLIAGLETPSDGTIHIGEQVVNHVAPKDRNIAMVFQNYALYPHMSVYKNMAFGLQLRYGGGWPARILKRLIDPPGAAELAEKRRGIDQQVRQAAEMLGIEHLLDRMPRQLSGGERQRVALGRAIVRKPAAFLFDEPLSNLDAKLRVEMRRELKRLHSQLQATMIYVTHDQVEALTLGQRIVVMENGRVQQVGAPMDVYDRPRSRFVASFIGTPPMNFVRGRMSEVKDKLQFSGAGLTAEFGQADLDETVWERRKQFANKDVVFGVRPEDVTAAPAASEESSTEKKNQGQVADVEVLGDSAVVQVELKTSGEKKQKANTFLLKTAARTTLAVGDNVELTVDVSRAHLFDPQTDENLTYTESK